MADETRILAAFVSGLTYEALSGEVVARVDQLALDFAGSIVRAGAPGETSDILFATLDDLELSGPGSARMVGSDRCFAPPVAALVNSVLGHSLDFDDTHAESSIHPTATVLPAALAIADKIGADGRRIATALVAGYEVVTRVGMALDPTSHYARGFHPSATAGVFGAAAAASSLLRLDEAGVVAAFGFAASQAAGSMQYVRNGAWTKRWQVGAASMNGVCAAMLARHHFPSSVQAIEGEPGFLASYSDAADAAKLVDGLGEVWQTLRIGVKPYPCCRYAHAALDGLVALRREGHLDPGRLRKVTIGLHRNGIALAGAPLDAKRRVRSIGEAQLSMPFTASLVIDQGGFGWDDLARVGDPGLDALCDLVDVRRDDGVEALPQAFGASIVVETGDGFVERFVSAPSGEADNFPTMAETREKFLALARPVLHERADALADSFQTLHRR